MVITVTLSNIQINLFGFDSLNSMELLIQD